MEWNWLTLTILAALFALWKLDLAATVTNLRAFPDKIPPPLRDWMDEAQLARAREYLVVNGRFHTLQATVGLGVLLLFWGCGGFAWLDQSCRSLAGGDILTGLLFIAALVLGQTILGLPFQIHDTFVIEQRFGFNKTTPRTFAADLLKNLLLGALLGLPLLAGILWIFLHVEHAWLWAWLLFTGFQIAILYLAPTWIMPLFNRFTPMEDGELRRSIQALGERCGFPLDGVFVMDGSKRSSKANAFFTGFGKRKKIALYDTLIEKSPADELLGVLAHEIGHFRRGHIRQRLAAGIFQTAILFFLLGQTIQPDGAFARLLFDSFGVAAVSPHVGLVLFSILFGPLGRLLGIPLNAWSRRHEFEADAYAAEVTGEAHALGRALKKLTADHLSHPSPARLRVWLDYSHPPLLERLQALEAAPHQANP
jgi:STE24 endopeptidase